MSLTPRAHSHLPPPQRTKQARGPLLPLEKPPTSPTLLRKLTRTSNQLTKRTTISALTKPPTNSNFLTKPTTSSTISTKLTSGNTLLTKPSSSSTTLSKPSSISTLLKKSTVNSTPFTKTSTSLTRIANDSNIRSNTRLPSGSLGTISSRLSSTKNPIGSLVSIHSSSNRETGLEQFKHKDDEDGSGLLPENEANISIDQLLAHWADKIDKAEQTFEKEELAFERAQARFATHNSKSFSSNPSARLLHKAKKIIGVDNGRPSPIKKHHAW